MDSLEVVLLQFGVVGEYLFLAHPRREPTEYIPDGYPETPDAGLPRTLAWFNGNPIRDHSFLT